MLKEENRLQNDYSKPKITINGRTGNLIDRKKKINKKKRFKDKKSLKPPFGVTGE
ncbi:MAG: hypothetical protein QMD43_04665 [Thermodesulfovibrio sp.]|uniref:hypothetical protein n=1 Tax=unclassified Thermodesulfovibrio TaxID=2645936 RepID=UPI0008551B7C|nr:MULTISPECIES: hypothetical protein [unclassified Thermodesulfovibrio]MDI1471634.1 hypothetical protein [Thermodesulfovibrio sp. 1176]MDI6714305.1 hypothetical protein [Thermodesulfovibrio sp.]ODA43927.1 hypothetical protein THER_1359 [Thermodesulfovibrio sp. N1]